MNFRRFELQEPADLLAKVRSMEEALQLIHNKTYHDPDNLRLCVRLRLRGLVGEVDVVQRIDRRQGREALAPVVFHILELERAGRVYHGQNKPTLL